jgi:hypothetical protein
LGAGFGVGFLALGCAFLGSLVLVAMLDTLGQG